MTTNPVCCPTTTPKPQVLKEGAGPSPPKGDEVVAHYTGTLEVRASID